MEAVFPGAVTAYLVSIERFSIYVAPAVSPHGGCDLRILSLLYQKAVDVVLLCSHHTLNKQWIFSIYCHYCFT